MAVKRGGLGKGLDSLIPENKSVKPAAKAEKEEKRAGQAQGEGKPAGPAQAVSAADHRRGRAFEAEDPRRQLYPGVHRRGVRPGVGGPDVRRGQCGGGYDLAPGGAEF